MSHLRSMILGLYMVSVFARVLRCSQWVSIGIFIWYKSCTSRRLWKPCHNNAALFFSMIILRLFFFSQWLLCYAVLRQCSCSVTQPWALPAWQGCRGGKAGELGLFTAWTYRRKHGYTDIGWYFVWAQFGQVRGTPRRMWSLIYAFEYISTAVVSRETVQRLLGHAMRVCACNRCGISVFRRLYDFVHSGCQPRVLNPKEKLECTVYFRWPLPTPGGWPQTSLVPFLLRAGTFPPRTRCPWSRQEEDRCCWTLTASHLRSPCKSPRTSGGMTHIASALLSS